MHGDASLGGPIFWIAVVVVYGAGLAALFVSADACRSCRVAAFGGSGALRFLWIAPQLVFLALFVLGNLPWTSVAPVSIGLMLSTPIVIALQFAYLLRIVYPKPGSASLEPALVPIATDPEE